MGRYVVIGEEVGVAGGDDPIGDEEACMPVIRMKAVATPRVVTEHDIGPNGPDVVRHRLTLLET
jgi:hypothetical protein